MNKPIEEQWLRFVKMMMPPSKFTEDQVAGGRSIFFAGAFSAIDLLREVLPVPPTDAGARYETMLNMYMELKQFKRDMTGRSE